MLRTNNKEVKKAIRNYIEDCLSEDYEFLTFASAAHFINDEFTRWYSPYEQHIHPNRQDAFIEFAKILPSGGVFDFWYYCSFDPVEILGNILQETAEEKSRYTNEQAAELLTKLIYREVYNAINRA